jgi:tRNA(Ile)-lysidine synthetase-like protein
LGKKACPSQPEKDILLDATGSHSWTWGGKRYTLALKRYPKPAGLTFPACTGNRAIFDAASISCTLQVRTRKDGDRFSPYGIRSVTRKLKTFLIEKKIPKGMRDSIPLVFSGGALAWVPGHGVSDLFKVGDATTSILEMELSCTNP